MSLDIHGRDFIPTITLSDYIGISRGCICGLNAHNRWISIAQGAQLAGAALIMELFYNVPSVG